MRRQQNALERVSDAAIEAALLAQKHAQIAFHFIGQRGTPEGARQEMDQHMMRRVFGLQLVARLGSDEPRAGLGILQTIFDALLRGRQIFLRMQGRKKQRLRGIVEAFAARAVGRQVVAGVDVDVQQVAQRGTVFVTVQSTDRGWAGLDAIGARGGAQQIIDGEHELLAGNGAGRFRSRGGHVTIANSLQHAAPGPGVVF